MTRRTEDEWSARVGNARASGRASGLSAGRTEAVSEILAAAILTSDNDAAEIISNVAELVAEGLTPAELDAAKARAVALVLEVGDVPEPGPVVA